LTRIYSSTTFFLFDYRNEGEAQNAIGSWLREQRAERWRTSPVYIWSDGVLVECSRALNA